MGTTFPGDQITVRWLSYPVKFLKEELKSISSGSFAPTKLKRIKLPNLLISTEPTAFADTESIEVSLESNIQMIGNSAFQNSNMRKVEMPDTVTSIGKNAFSQRLVGVDSRLLVPYFGSVFFNSRRISCLVSSFVDIRRACRQRLWCFYF